MTTRAILAIHNNALGLPVNGIACEGMSVEVFDTGSIHHRADATISAFDIPTGAGGNVSASVVLRSQTPVAGAGLTAYTLSHGYNTDGSTFISCFRWNAGVGTQVGTSITAGVPAPSPSYLFSGSISGSTLTAFVNNIQVASFTDTTITAGSFAGLHFFRNIAASNCYVTTFIPFAVAGPVAPPPGSRDVKLWPFPSSDPFNMPRGDGCTFDGRPLIPGNININTIAYGVSINGAGYTSPAQVDGQENHHCDIQADGVTVHGFNTFMGANLFTTCNIQTGTSYNVTVIGNASQYERATKMSGMAGPLRNWECQAAAGGDIHAIKHAIGLACSSHILNTTFTWPAFASDSFSGSNIGFMPEGGLMAIPSTATMPTGLNALSQAFWQALHDYGAYAVDATGNFGNPNDTLTVVEGEAAAQSILGSLQTGAIMAQLRWVTNNSQSNVGGPGNRLAPLAPAV